MVIRLFSLPGEYRLPPFRKSCLSLVNSHFAHGILPPKKQEPGLFPERFVELFVLVSRCQVSSLRLDAQVVKESGTV